MASAGCFCRIRAAKEDVPEEQQDNYLEHQLVRVDGFEAGAEKYDFGTEALQEKSTYVLV